MGRGRHCYFRDTYKFYFQKRKIWYRIPKYIKVGFIITLVLQKKPHISIPWTKDLEEDIIIPISNLICLTFSTNQADQGPQQSDHRHMCSHMCLQTILQKPCLILAFCTIKKQTEKNPVCSFSNKVERQTLEGSKRKRETWAVK